MWEFGRCSDAEGLKLILAFLQIDDPGIRAKIVAMAETAAAQSLPVASLVPALQQDNLPNTLRTAD